MRGCMQSHRRFEYPAVMLERRQREGIVANGGWGPSVASAGRPTLRRADMSSVLDRYDLIRCIRCTPHADGQHRQQLAGRDVSLIGPWQTVNIRITDVVPPFSESETRPRAVVNLGGH